MAALNLGRFLRDYSGALSALAAVVLIAITAWYAHLTHVVATAATEQVREASKTRIDQSMPDVHAYAELTRIRAHQWRLGLRARNEGAVFANVFVELGTDNWVASPPHELFGNLVRLDIAPGTSDVLTFTVTASDPSEFAPGGSVFSITAAGKVGGAHDEFEGTVDDTHADIGRAVRVLVLHEQRVYHQDRAMSWKKFKRRKGRSRGRTAARGATQYTL